jgi:hypothetical protein
MEKILSQWRPLICSLTHIFLDASDFCSINFSYMASGYKHTQCYSIVSCAPLILIGAHFLSLNYTPISLLWKTGFHFSPGFKTVTSVRDLTRDGRLNTYIESVPKLSKVSFRGQCARTGHPLKLPSPTKHARLGHISSAGQIGLPAGPVFYILYLFSIHTYFHKVLTYV